MKIDANEEELEDKRVDWDRVDGEETALGRWRQSDERRIQVTARLFGTCSSHVEFNIRFSTFNPL
jgi:hypothetical protein